MKRIISILILCVMLAGIMLPASADSFATAFMPKDIANTQPVTREVFAYAVSHLIDYGTDMEPVDTVFDDVKADNAYSGYIKKLSEMGILNGVGNNLFMPDAYITADQVSKVFVSLLGYDVAAIELGGYAGGYNIMAQRLSLFKGVYGDLSVITAENLSIIIENLLKTPVGKETLYIDGNDRYLGLEMYKDGETFGERIASLYTYDVSVIDADIEKGSIKVEFGEVAYGNRYKEGDIKEFSLPKGTNVISYIGTPASILVDRNDNVVSIGMSSDVNADFGVVTSVNGDTSDKGYNISYLDEITIKGHDGEYEFTEDTIFHHNGKECTGVMNLMDEYVRIITKGNEVAYIGTWDFVKGGIVKGRTINQLLYVDKGKTVNLTGFDECSLRTTILDGRYIDYSSLPVGSVFYYYMDLSKNSIIIIASQYSLEDKLSGVDFSEKTLHFENISFPYNDDVLVLNDDKTFSSDKDDILDLSNTTVKAYIDPYGRVCCVEGIRQDSNEIFGYLLGYNGKKGLSNEERILFLDLKDGANGGKEYIIADNCTFDADSNVTHDSFFASSGKITNNDIYEITVNDSGFVTNVTVPMRFEGFETAALSDIRSFIEASPMYLTVDKQKLYFDSTTPFYVAYENKGVMISKKMVYSALRARSVSEDGLIVTFYGYPDQGEVRFVTLTGNITKIEGNQTTGIVEMIASTLNGEGKPVSSAYISGKQYLLTDADASKLKKDMLVTVTVPIFGEYASLESYMELDNIFNTDVTLDSNLKRINVKKAYNNRLILDDGSTIFYHSKSYKIWKQNSLGEFTEGIKEDIKDGDEVIIYVKNKEIAHLFYQGY